jgi:hypothetical protein
VSAASGEPVVAASTTPTRASRRPASPLAALTLVGLIAGLSLASSRIASDPRVFQGDRAGLVGPGAALLGVSPQTLTLAAWLVALALAALAAWMFAHAHDRSPDAVASEWRNEHPAPSATDPVSFPHDTRGAALSVIVACLVGVALRVRDVLHAGWDLDEPWAQPSRASLFDDSHDALIHPPFGRALFEGWGALVGWAPGDAVSLLRAPSLFFGTATLAFLALFAWRRLASSRSSAAPAGLALLAAALSPAAREVATLARPYALAAFLVVALVVVVVDAQGRRLTSAEAAAAALAASLAWFVDLPAGLFAALVVVVRGVHDLAAHRVREALTFVAASIVPALPLLPGALRAVALGVDPSRSPIAGPIPDLRPLADTSWLSRAASLMDALAHPFPAWTAPLVLGGVVAALLRRRAYLPASFAALAAALPLALAQVVALRARNVAWVPLVVCAIVASLARPLLPRAPCDTSAPPTRD